MKGRLPHDVEAIAAVLAGIPLFRVLGESGIRSTAGAGLARRYRSGQIIFHQGDPGESLYVLLDGLVKVVFTTEHGDEIVLNMLGRGETFGEMALLDGSPRSASIVTARAAWVFALPRARLLELMREHPGLADEFLRMLGHMVRRLTDQAADLAFLDLGGRLAKLLLQLADKHGQADGVVELPGLTQSDLAALIGASRPAVNRALQSLVSRNLIAVQGRTITLLDVAALRKRGGL
ncbi:Crp/Fnr family transcriptional regulator [Nonomuraea sp. KC401]|uniref:Crp/Fnr family transcriptional regulator n=1 Tax=unclassified Nonomuraea TaxID=2593643 RepID=UPI0010FE5110|nr:MULTISPECIES: Crp/Fnr family transcriptional regulator [unclassified Nonomuraea]NBE99629.1 cyclic nucleotide-binding domain-containing protein [Nonomuraea sp. K271]TLF73871.1 Crp/Fnr family transcriptional regulator [Nonomuraea sp. KC401]